MEGRAAVGQDGRKPTVLYIEDNFENKLLVRRILKASGYNVLEAEDGISGVELAREKQPDLIIMDLNLPGMDGYEATTKLKSMEECKEIPIVALTAKVLKGDKERSLAAGCDGYLQKPIDPDTFVSQIEEYLGGKVERLEHRIESDYLREYSQQLVKRLEDKILELEKKNKQLLLYFGQMQETYVGIMTSLTRAIEEKHPYTAGHSERVTRLVMDIAEEMKLSPADRKTLRRSAQLHDVGKLVIEISSIDKPGKLDGEEWEAMRKHTEIGTSILGPLKFLSKEIEVIADHHERLDGSGYPRGKKGDEISLFSMILAVADSYDAMTSYRSYMAPLSEEEAMEKLKQDRGTKLREEVVEAFLRTRRRAR